ncbi:MAG: type I 3-dehydroquinate dehydratase [Candidatus Peribacteraceae bacterium]|nr:type I 3-dehydroquinate dehydratase [Candidatus Peribacteraceae bacterium]
MFVVTLPPSAQKNPRAFALKAKKAGADLLEIRGDLTPNVKALKSPLPLIVSPRGKGFGLIERMKPEYVDLDMGEAPTPDPSPGHLDRFALSVQPGEGRKPKVKLIVSYHNYDRTPSLSDLQKIVQKMCAKSGTRRPGCGGVGKIWAIKIATKIVDYKDLLIHRDLHDWMKSFCRAAKFCGSTKQIVLGMGDKAYYSRITSPMRNVLTYTFLHGSEAAAPGQLPISFYKILNQGSRYPWRPKPCLQGIVTKKRGRRLLPAEKSAKSYQKIFGIIGGDQIVHSLSPTIHNLLFQQYGIDALYSCFPTDDFKGTMKILEKLGIAGLSVTAPFKHDAFAFTDQVDPIGKELGAVNTLIKKNGMWKAFNTDVIGIERGYPFLKLAQSIAILGAGGVVPAVIEGIRRINSEACITVFARDPEKAERDFIHRCHGSTPLTMTTIRVCLLDEAINATADAVICAVSQDIALPLPKHGIKSVAIDLRYGKETKFLRSAAAKGFRVYDGLSMLLHQALAQFQLFTGMTPNMKNFNYDQYFS